MTRCFRHIEDPAAKSRILSALLLLKERGCADGDSLYVCEVVDSVTMFSHCRYPKGVKGVYAWQLLVTPSTEAALKELYTDDFLADTKWILRNEMDLLFWDRLQRVKANTLRRISARSVRKDVGPFMGGGRLRMRSKLLPAWFPGGTRSSEGTRTRFGAWRIAGSYGSPALPSATWPAYKPPANRGRSP